MRNVLVFLFSPLFLVPAAFGQSAAPPEPSKIGDVTVSRSLRTRIESWDSFQGNGNNDYTFPGSILRVSLSESTKHFDWQLEFAAPFLLALPDDAIAPARKDNWGSAGAPSRPTTTTGTQGWCSPSRDF